MLISVLWKDMAFVIKFGLLTIDEDGGKPPLISFFLIIFWPNYLLNLFFESLNKLYLYSGK